MARDKIKSATDQRKFTIVYNDFLDSDILNYYEKIIFIYLKKYADNETLKSFPSLNTLHKVTGISRSKIQECIASMTEKGVLAVQRRDTDKGHQSNLYTLYDYGEVWGVSGDNQEKDLVTEEISEAKMIAKLREKGYFVTKKELASVTVASPDASSRGFNSKSINKYKGSENKNQEERYSMNDLHEIYDYDSLVSNHDHKDVDAVFSILYDTLNTHKQSIRIGKEDRPAMVVIGKLMRLDYSDICFVIQKFNEQSDRIKNPTAYMLTQLYNAKEQNHLDLMNQGHVNGDF